MSAIELQVRGEVAEIALDRPKVNAMDGGLFRDLHAAVDEAAADGRVRGILLLGRGRCFSAGLDLKALLELDRRELSGFLDAFDAAIRSYFSCPKPVAAAVGGHAIAGGLVLALGADYLALEDDRYRVGLTELAVGVPFPHLAFEIVRSALPPRALRRLVYTAGLLDPREAFELGVGDALVSDAPTAAREWLGLVASRPLETFGIAKQQLRAEALARADAGLAGREPFLEAVFAPEVRRALEKALRPARGRSPA